MPMHPRVPDCRRDPRKPYKVFRLHETSQVVAYYEAQMTRVCVDQHYLRQAIDRARKTNPEVIVAEYATLEKAQVHATRLNDNVPVPGIRYVAEHFDI